MRWRELPPPSPDLRRRLKHMQNIFLFFSVSTGGPPNLIFFTWAIPVLERILHEQKTKYFGLIHWRDIDFWFSSLRSLPSSSSPGGSGLAIDYFLGAPGLSLVRSDTSNWCSVSLADKANEDLHWSKTEAPCGQVKYYKTLILQVLTDKLSTSEMFLK